MRYVRALSKGSEICLLLGVVGLMISPSYADLDYKPLALGLGLSGAIALLGLSAIWRKSVRLEFPALLIPVCLYFAWEGISVLTGSQATVAWGAWRRELLYLASFLCYARFLRRPGRLSAAVLLALGLMTGYGLAQAAGYEFLEGYSTAQFSGRIFASFGNPNLYAAASAVLLPLVLELSIHRTGGTYSRLARSLGPVAVLLIGWTLLLSGSRAGILAAVHAIMLHSIFLLREPRWRKRGVASLVCVGVVACLAVWWMPREMVQRETDRPLVYDASMDLIKRRAILGHGYASFASELPAYLSEEMRQALSRDNTFVRHAHNEMLEKTAEEGLVGLAVFLWLIYCVFSLGKRSMRLEPWRPHVRVVLSGLTALLITNSLGIDMRLPAGRGMFFIMLALLPGQKGILLPRRLEWELNSRLARAGCLVACLCLSFLLTSQVTTPVLAGQRVDTSEDFFELGKAAASDDLQRLLSIRDRGGDSPNLFLGIGDQYARLGDWWRAEENYRECLTRDPESNIAALRLGNTVFNQGRLEDAEGIFYRLVSRDRYNAEAHYNLGYVLFCRKKTKQALMEFNQVLALDPEHAGAATLKARIIY